MAYCKVCEKKISLFARIFAKKCNDCNVLIHKKCALSILDFDSYSQGIIFRIEPLCDRCITLYSAKFGDEKFCSTCGVDFTISNSQAKCNSCGQIGHAACYEIFSKKIDVKWIYPHLYPNESHTHFCASCFRTLEEKMKEVRFKAENEWVGGVRSGHMGGHRIIKPIGKVECNETSLCKEPDDVFEYLKIRAIQLGANAYVNSFWKRETYRYEERYIRGYGKKGNPYYGTRYYIEEWFIGHADAVIVEPNCSKNNTHYKKI